MTIQKLEDWIYNNDTDFLVYDIDSNFLQFAIDVDPPTAFTREMIEYYTNLLIIQYKSKPKAKATIAALISSLLANNLCLKVRDGFNIDTAIGVQLDILGLYIGVDRFYKYNDYPLAFGFSNYLSDEPINVTGFADASDFFTKDGTFLSVNETIAETGKLNDEEYRILLKLKIIQNHCNFSTKEIDDALYLFFGDIIYVVDNYNMTLTYYYDDTQLDGIVNLQKVIEAALYKKVIPKPMGVSLNTPIGIA